MIVNRTLIEKEILSRYRKISLMEEFWAWRRLKIMPFWELEKLAPPSGKIVDLGCGRGIFSLLLGGASARRIVTGIDLSAARLRVAKKASQGFRNIDFIYGDVCQKRFRNVDCFFLNEVLYLIPFEDQIKLLKFCTKALKKGGWIIIKFFNLKNSTLFPYRKYFLALSQTKIICRLYDFLFRFSPFRGATVGILGKRARGPFLWEEMEIEETLSSFGLNVCKKILNKHALFPHPVFICKKL